jgi:adenylylsulfate kinase-like enzyme
LRKDKIGHSNSGDETIHYLAQSLFRDTIALEMMAEQKPRCKGDSPERSSSYALRSRGQGLTIWFTGLSGAGKSTLCQKMEADLLALGILVEVLDWGLSFARSCGKTSVSADKIGEKMLCASHLWRGCLRGMTLWSWSRPSAPIETIEEARRTIGNSIEVYVSGPVEVCEVRPERSLPDGQSEKNHALHGDR